MLTNIHYYKFYKPYIVRTREKEAVYKNRNVPKEYLHNNKEDRDFLLNATHRDEIINYAEDLTSYVNTLKESAYQTERSFRELAKSETEEERRDKTEDFDLHISSMFMDLHFAVDFAKNQEYSHIVDSFGDDLVSQWNEHKSNFSKLGLTMSRALYGEGPEEIETIDRESLVNSGAEILSFLQNIQEKTDTVLKEPLMEHFDFNELDFYYSYKYDYTTANTYQLIDVGMLVDIAI